MLPRGLAPFFLVSVFSFVWVANGIWLYLDDRPPLWDMATHLTFGLKYLDAFQRGDSWTQILQISHYYPPFFHWIVALFFALFGRHLDLGILANAGATALILVSVYRLGKRFYGDGGALVAAALSVTYPMMSWVSREAWPDYWLTAFAVWSVDWIFRSDTFRKRVPSIFFGVSVGLGTLTKWTFPLFVAGPFLCALWNAKVPQAPAKPEGSWRQVSSLILALGACLLLVLPWYAANLEHLKTGYAGFKADGASETDPPGWALAGLLYYVRGMLSYQLFAPFFLLLLYGLLRALRAWDSRHLVFLSWILVPWAVLLVLPNKDQRFLLPALPAVALLSTHWISGLASRKRLLVTVGTFTLALFLYLVVAFPILPVPEKITLGREAYFSYRERLLTRGPDGYEEQLKVWPAEWNLFATNYLGILGPPRREDWRLGEILNQAVARNGNPGHTARIALIPDLQRLNEGNLTLYATLYRTPVEVTRVRSVRDPPEATFDSFSLVVVKKGNQGAEWTTRGNAEIYQYLEEHPQRFYPVAGYSLPDGTEAVLLAVK